MDGRIIALRLVFILVCCGSAGDFVFFTGAASVPLVHEKMWIASDCVIVDRSRFAPHSKPGELKLYFYPSAGGLKREKKRSKPLAHARALRQQGRGKHQRRYPSPRP